MPMSTFPARVQLVAADEPLPLRATPGIRRAIATNIRRCVGDYQARLSGPLLDRVDLHVHVAAVSAIEHGAAPRPAEGQRRKSPPVWPQPARGRWHAAGALQCRARRADKLEGAFATPDEAGRKLLLQAAEKLRLSARGPNTRMLRYARSIADLCRSRGRGPGPHRRGAVLSSDDRLKRGSNRTRFVLLAGAGRAAFPLPPDRSRAHWQFRTILTHWRPGAPRKACRTCRAARLAPSGYSAQRRKAASLAIALLIEALIVATAIHARHADLAGEEDARRGRDRICRHQSFFAPGGRRPNPAAAQRKRDRKRCGAARTGNRAPDQPQPAQSARTGLRPPPHGCVVQSGRAWHATPARPNRRPKPQLATKRPRHRSARESIPGAPMSPTDTGPAAVTAPIARQVGPRPQWRAALRPRAGIASPTRQELSGISSPPATGAGIGTDRLQDRVRLLCRGLRGLSGREPARVPDRPVP